jgi:hypothetical protein
VSRKKRSVLESKSAGDFILNRNYRWASVDTPDDLESLSSAPIHVREGGDVVGLVDGRKDGRTELSRKCKFWHTTSSVFLPLLLKWEMKNDHPG